MSIGLFDTERAGTGTREWSEHSLNIGTGCSHNCLYGYCRENALRYKRIQSAEDWPIEKLNDAMLTRVLGKKSGVIMIPTMHDVTPYYLDSFIVVAGRLLKKGNSLLVTTKPHLRCVMAMCEAFTDYKEQVLFRFTIGSTDPKVCAYWEPGAPTPEERVASLAYAFGAGYRTSVSIEPMLEGPQGAIDVVRAVDAHVTDTIWIGTMNKVSSRVRCPTIKDHDEVQAIKEKQQDSLILFGLVPQLSSNPKIRWKNSIKEVMARNGMEVR